LSQLFQTPFVPALGITGLLLSGAKMAFYETGTTTLATVYDDDGDPISQAANIFGTVGVEADMAGRFPNIYLDDAVVYRARFMTAQGSVIGEADPISDTTFLNLAADTGSSLVGFIQAGAGAVARTVQSKLRDEIHVHDFGAVGDNVADDTAAIANAINYAQSLTFTPKINFGTGYYKIVSFPTITKPLTIEGDDPQICQIMCSGTADVFNIHGSGTRANSVTFRNLTLNGNAMTNGYLVNIDWAQNITFDNIYFNNPWDGVYARQVGNLRFVNGCLMSTVRGDVGIDLFGNNTTRNGENDQIDLVAFNNMVVQSDLPASGGSNSVIMLRADGRVHTIQFDGLRLLNGGIGLQTLNTPGLAANLTPRFFLGSSLEIENMYEECLDLQAGSEFTPAFLFAAGSHTADGVKLNANFSWFAPARCSINSNGLAGIDMNGAPYVHLNKPLIYNNSTDTSGAKSGIYASGSGILTVEGGLIGEDTSYTYTEAQKRGVEMDAAFTGIMQLKNVDLRGNAGGPIYDSGTSAVGTKIEGCAGYNPVGTDAVVVGASPFLYTAGPTDTYVNLFGGTVSNVSVEGDQVASASPCSFFVPARMSATITHAGAPTMIVTRA